MNKKETIAALFAKAESTDYEGERDLYVEKAEKMMLRMGIERAELESAGEVKAEEIIEVRRQYTGGYAASMVTFVHAVALGWGNVTVLQSQLFRTKGTGKVAYLIGHKSDVEALGLLLTSLEAQARRALLAWKRANPAPADARRLNNARSFLESFGNTVGATLRQRRTESDATASTGAELVLISKAERLNDYMAEAYPKLGKGRGGRRASGWQGAVGGRAAGERANLGEKGIGGSRGALR